MSSTSSNNRLSSWQEFEERFCASKWIEVTLGLLDRLLARFLWFCFTAVVILGCSVSLNLKAVPCFAIFFSFLSLFAHFVHEIASVLREYPYWRSVDLKRKDRRIVSEPILASCVVFFLLTFRSSCVLTTLYILGFVFIYDYLVASRASSYAESVFRLFIEKLMLPPSVEEKVELGTSSKVLETKTDESIFSPYYDWDSHCPSDSFFLDNEESEDVVLSIQRRSLTKDGNINISGLVRMEIESGLENAVAWISFCPSFERTPKFEFEQIGDDDVVVEVSFVQPYGTRLEARRRHGSVVVDEKAIVTVEFFASSSTSNR